MKRAITTVIILAFTSAAYAAGEPMAFLKLGAGVRATGMGGAYTAVSDDAAGVFYNPVGICAIKSLQFSAETYLLSFGRNVNYISVCKPFNIGGRYYSAGLSWFNYSAGSDIEARSTNSPQPERKFSDSTHLVILTAATGFSDRFYTGINAKLDLRAIDDVRATGFGFDAGAMLKILGGLSVGVAASNLSGNVWWDNKQYNEPAPQNYSLGLSYSHSNIFGVPKLCALVSADFSVNTFGFVKLKCGGEIKANEFFFLRAGYNGAFTAGCGAVFAFSRNFSMKVDYALAADTVVEAALNHRVGLTFDLMIDEKTPENPAPDTAEKKEEGDDEEKPW